MMGSTDLAAPCRDLCTGGKKRNKKQRLRVKKHADAFVSKALPDHQPVSCGLHLSDQA